MRQQMSSIKERFGAKLAQLGMRGLRGGDAMREPPIPPDPPVPVSEEEVVAFESMLGARLPDDYRQFLREIGAAGLSETCVRPIQIREDYGDVEVFEVFYGGKEEKFYDVWRNRDAFRGRIPENMTPIAAEAGGGQFCIVVNGPGYGKIYFYCRDDGKLYLTADSFDDFLNRLEPNPY
jgi:hypothetical protein